MGRVWTSQTIISGGYVGPGDVVGGATAWWGLRAYTVASIGTNVVRLREDGGNTEQDFPSIAGGGLNLAAIITFKGANNLFVTKLYDQTGNGFDWVQATAANQAPFILSAIGTLPTIRGDGSTARFYTNALVSNVAFASASSQCVIKPTVGANSAMLGASATNGYEFRVGSTGALDLLQQNVDGFSSTGTLTTATWATVGVTFDGTNYVFYINGASAGSGSHVLTFNASTGVLFSNIGVSEFYNGDFAEYGVWPGILNSTQEAAMSSNQHTYWGF